MTAAVPNSEPASAGLGYVARNARRISASQVIRRLFRMAALLVAARMLGVTAFGVYIVLLTVVEMVALLSGYGYMDFLTREVAKQPDAAWPLASRTTFLRLAYALPVLALALMVLKLLRLPSVSAINAALLSITLAPRMMGESAQGVMKGLQLFRPLPWVELARGVIVLAGVAGFLWAGFGLRGVISAEILGAVGGAIVATWSVSGHMQLAAVHAPGLRALARSTLAFNLYPFMVSVYDRADVILLSKLAGSLAAGIYSLPYRAFAALQIVPYSVMGSLLPGFSAATDKNQLRQTCSAAMKFLLLVSFLAILLTLSFARPVIVFVLGPGYEKSVATVQILVWASVPGFLNSALNTLVLAAGKEQIFFKTATTCAVFNILANLLLIPRFSYLAAAAVTILTECLLLAQNLYWMKKVAGYFVFPKDGARIAAIFLIALAAFWAAARALPQPWPGTMACLIFAVSCAGIVRGLRQGVPRVGAAGTAIDPLNGSLSS